MVAKPILTADEAVQLIHEGNVVMLGGFMGCGSPAGLLDALEKPGTRNLTLVCNDTALHNLKTGEMTFVAKLVAQKQFKKMIVTHIGLNGETQRQMHAGETEVQLVPGMGGAMDLTVGAKKVFAATQHFDNAGVSKLMRKCRLPLTAAAEVDYIVTDVGFFEVRNNAFILKEYFTPYTVEYILAGTNADIVVDKDCMEVDLS